MLPEDTIEKLKQGQAKMLKGIQDAAPAVESAMEAYEQLGKDFRKAEKRVTRKLKSGIRKTSDIPL